MIPNARGARSAAPSQPAGVAGHANVSKRLRSLHALAQRTRSELRLRFWLRLHVGVIALLTLLAFWGASAFLMRLGLDALPLRYGLAMLIAYAVYLLLLRVWAGALARRESPLDGLDPPQVDGSSGAGSCESAEAQRPEFSSGGGGDFAGGGASASFDGAPAEVPVGEIGGRVLEGAGDALGSADEGIVIAVPLVAVLGLVALIFGVLGSAVWLLFGVEVLLAVTVEVVLASVAGSIAYKGLREGWLWTAFAHTWRGAVAVTVLVVSMGALIEWQMPEAASLPHAVRLWSGK
jgi:hypothetical protein